MATIPDRIGRYEVLRLLGHGGMGVLYLARDPVIDRHVALKLLKVDDEALRQRFVREAQSAGRLQHPNIVTVYDVGDHDGELFIAMEYIDGDTMATLIRNEVPFSTLRRLEMIDQLADGLGFAHNRSIVHRDIKPANLMVTRSGLLKVLDFGIARLTHGELAAGSMAGGGLIGTPAYMAPEQLAGSQVDHRADIFAVGLVLYELLSGRRAFVGDSTAELLRSVMRDEPVPLNTLVPLIDMDLVRCVNRALAKRPEDRYQGLQELRNDIGRVRRRSEYESGAFDATIVVPQLSHASHTVAPPPPLPASAVPAPLPAPALPRTRPAPTPLPPTVVSSTLVGLPRDELETDPGGFAPPRPAPPAPPRVHDILSDADAATVVVPIYSPGAAAGPPPVHPPAPAPRAAVEPPPSSPPAQARRNVWPAVIVLAIVVVMLIVVTLGALWWLRVVVGGHLDPAASTEAVEEAPVARADKPTATAVPVPVQVQVPVPAPASDAPAAPATEPPPEPRPSPVQRQTALPAPQQALAPQVPPPAPPPAAASTSVVDQDREAPAPVPVPRDEGLALVRAYVAARNMAHAAGIRRLWPTVSDTALRRMTSEFSAPLTLTDCDVEGLDAGRMRATCRFTQPGATASAGTALSVRRQLVFDLARQGRGWVIADVEG